MIEDKLMSSDKDRLLLLETIGADSAVRLGAPEAWRAAIAKLPQ
jgi:hypothetical protein